MKEKRIKIIHMILLVLGTIFLLSGAFHNGVWFDESYTVGLMNQNLVDLCKAATYDVHPLLYYILLRLYAYVFGNSIVALRLFSVLGAVLLELLGYTHIRRDFGEKTGVWFSFFIVTMPSTFKYALQIRMYTWTPLLVTLTAIYAYRMVKNTNNSNNINNTKNTKNTLNTILFAIFSVMAAYMHYYGLMAAVVINVMLLVYYIKNKTNLKKWLIIATIQILGYLPGIYVFWIQLKLSNGSWISIKLDTLLDTISFHFLGVPQKDVRIGSLIHLVSLLIGTCLYILIGYLLVQMTKKNKERAKPAGLALTVYFGVIFVFLIISIWKPLYYVRYSIISYGLLIFAFSYLLASYHKTYLKIIIVIVMLGISVARAIPIYNENYDNSNTLIDDYLKKNMRDGDILLFDNAGAFAVSVKYQNVPTYFYNVWNWNITRGYKAFGNKVTIITDLDDIRDYSGRIWIIDEDLAYKEVMSWYGTSEISNEVMQLKYYEKENKHEIILIEKK